MTRPVVTDDGVYAVALAELPERALRVTAIAGSIVVIDGAAGWGARLSNAVTEGAAAIVLAEPRSLGAHEFLAAGTPAVPVIVDRARLRHDVVGDARPTHAPGSVRVECASSDLDLALRDAVGWVRVLAGGEFELHEVRVTGRAVMLHLRRGAVDGSVLLSRRELPSAWWRAIGIGAERVQVSHAHPAATLLVERSSSAGVLTLPRRYESHERLSMRRALEALDTAERPGDLVELEHDSRIATHALA